MAKVIIVTVHIVERTFRFVIRGVQILKNISKRTSISPTATKVPELKRWRSYSTVDNNRLHFSILLLISWPIFSYWLNTFIVNTKAVLENAAKEAVWCYHKMHAGPSFGSSDCVSGIMREVFKQSQFHLGHTKCAAIASNVFAQQIVDEIKRELKASNFVSIATIRITSLLKCFPLLPVGFLHRMAYNQKY